MDVFIGGRAVPGNYGLTPGSFLFIQDQGQWVNRTPESIGTVGMVTGGTWTDLNTDGRPDLVMVGDWMPISVAFTLNGGTISDVFKLPGTEGWWNSVESADLDGDGKEDLVATNWGLNSKFTASPEQPLKMHVADFDGNQKTEFIIEWYPPGNAGDGKAYPFAGKKTMHAQLPPLRKTTLKYDDYARATYETLIPEPARTVAKEYRTERLASVVVWNEGKGNFKTQELPWQAQLTQQYAAAIGDVNADGKPDIWMGGNRYGLAPQVGRADAGRGSLLLNDGDRSFTYVAPAAAGVSVRGQVRDAAFVELADGGRGLLVGCNNDPLRLFRTTTAPTTSKK